MPAAYRAIRRVEFRDTDAAGIMHFSAYFTYMEEVEHELLRSLGTSVVTPLDPADSTQGELSWPRVAAECQFVDSAHFEDVLEIEAYVARIGYFQRDLRIPLPRGRPRNRPRFADQRLLSVPPRSSSGIRTHRRSAASATHGIPAAVNPQPTYLQSLTMRLAAGLEHVPEEVRNRHARFLLAAQQPDGGFTGRQGSSDLYYTSFALRGLAILGELYGDVARRSADFLRSRLAGKESLIDLMSLVFGAASLDAAAGIDLLAETDDDWKTAFTARAAGLAVPRWRVRQRSRRNRPAARITRFSRWCACS